MVFAIIHSLKSLVWVFVVIVFFKYCFVIFFLHGVTEYIRQGIDAGGDNEYADSLESMFGTIVVALLTLFECITGGRDWHQVAWQLGAISWVYGATFVFYIFIMVFSVLNVVTGYVVQTTSQAYKRDRELIIDDEKRRLNEYAKNIKEFFAQADKDKSGQLSWEEFESYMADDKVKAYFQTLDLDVSQAHLLFTLLDLDGSNGVGVDEFVDGCFRLKGPARSIDVNMLVFQVEKLLSGMVQAGMATTADHLAIHIHPDDAESADPNAKETEDCWLASGQHAVNALGGNAQKDERFFPLVPLAAEIGEAEACRPGNGGRGLLAKLVGRQSVSLPDCSLAKLASWQTSTLTLLEAGQTRRGRQRASIQPHGALR